MWTLHTDSGNSLYGGQYAKNIYLGDTRILTKLNSGKDPTYQEERQKQYYYHSDHLGSASLISDYNGKEYQRIEYTPYGEKKPATLATNSYHTSLPVKKLMKKPACIIMVRDTWILNTAYGFQQTQHLEITFQASARQPQTTLAI